jgi:hypothetical protein
MYVSQEMAQIICATGKKSANFNKGVGQLWCSLSRTYCEQNSKMFDVLTFWPIYSKLER